MPDHRSHEGWAATDSAHRQQKAPARPTHAAVVVDVTCKGSYDAETLNGVVRPEADDQQKSQCQLPAGGRLTDGQTLGEVVQTDTDRNQQREPAGIRP
jgi:hypothetical protein